MDRREAGHDRTDQRRDHHHHLGESQAWEEGARGMYRRLRLGGSVTLLAAVLTTVSAGAGARSPAATGEAASIIAWNDAALNAVVTVAKQPPPQAIVTMALVQAAVYDAVVAIKGGYQPYLSSFEPAPDASVDAAVATAAHAVL